MREFEQRILERGLEIGGEREWASGTVANNKLDMDHVYADEGLREEIVAKLGELALPLNPKVIVPLPEGANKWGEALGEKLDLPVRLLKTLEKGPNLRKYKFKRPLWTPKPKDALILDDIFNYGTSLNGVMDMRCVQEYEVTIAGFLAIWDRSPDNLPKRSNLKQLSVVRKHIPEIITETSEFQKYAV